MKKHASVMLYPGVVLRSNGMIIIPRLPRPKPDVQRLSLMSATLSRISRMPVSARRK